MSSTLGLDMIRVSLGAVGRDNPSSSSESQTPTKTTTGITPSATRLPQAPDGPPGSTTSPSSVSPSISRAHSKEPSDAPSSTLSLSEAGQTQTHSPNPKGEPGPGKRGFIIGAVLAALALGAILGAFVVIILKRRTKLKSHALASGGPGGQAQVSAFVVLSEGAEEPGVRNDNSKRAADCDRDEMGTGGLRTRTVVSEDLPSYRSSVEL